MAALEVLDLGPIGETELRVEGLAVLEDDPDEGVAKKSPRRSLDDKAENGPPEWFGLQAETGRLAVGFLSAETEADDRESSSVVPAAAQSARFMNSRRELTSPWTTIGCLRVFRERAGLPAPGPDIGG